MTDGLDITFEVLTQTENEAAVGVLVPALDAPYARIQHEALRAILERRSPLGQREILRRLHAHGEAWREILGEFSGRFSAALRDAVLGSDSQMCVNACQAMVWYGEYDLIPALINAAEDETNSNADLAGKTLLELADMLYCELASPRDERRRRDPQLVCKHVVDSLELSIKRFAQHKRREVIEASLILMSRDNLTLGEVLRDPLSKPYLTMIDVLTHSARPGVMRLLLSFLDDPAAPSAVLNVFAHRGDLAFLSHVCRKIGHAPSAHVAQNLRRIDRLVWFRHHPEVLCELDDAGQQGAVQWAVTSSAKRFEVYELLEYVLRNGKTGGRRAAITALAAHTGADANALVIESLDDPDPQVQAAALSQLRQRGIPGAMARLIEMIDSPYEPIRLAVRESLAEFRFERYLSAFDLLEDDVRVSTGLIVKKLDPGVIPGLVEELSHKSRTRRIRGLEAAVALGVVPALITNIIQCTQDEDHVVRSGAVRALRHCDALEARHAIVDALNDRSPAVREAARESLEQFS